MIRAANFLLIPLAFASRLAAGPLSIPAAESLQPPSTPRLVSVCAAAQRDGWAPQIAGLRAAAVSAYAAGRFSAAEAWFNAYRWAGLFGESEMHFIPRWIQAVNEAKVGHPNMPARYLPRERPLGLAVAPDLQAWLVGNAAFSAEFFALLAPVDYVPKVFEILDDLNRGDPARFVAYAHLALAIAVVYDVPPPPDWPHAQVTVAALPRKFPAAADAFT